MSVAQLVYEEHASNRRNLERRTNKVDDQTFDLSEFGSIPREYYAIEVPKLMISEAIRQGLEDSGLSFRKAANQIQGLSYTQISRITAGENYNIETLLKVLDVLGLCIRIERK